MPIQIQDIHEQEDSPDCPLCMETLEVDDINFFPCQCGYQICRFCWHRIRTDENGLCPACRKPYPENPAEFKPLSDQELQKIRLEKKQKEVARKQKITDSRKHLANVRVLQKNLVFVVGLSQRLADVEILKRQEYFGKYGKILKVVLNSNTSYAGTQTPSCSAYVTYSKMEESLRAIQSVNNVHIDGRTLKASLGTTKYCSNYLKNQQCMKHDCMYLHEIGEEDASFTKEDMQMAKHQEYEQKLIQQMIQKEISAQQDIRSKALRQDDFVENGGGSAGSSPPCSTGIITQGLSVAQAVKKNTKVAAEASRPRRHSSSTPSSACNEPVVSEADPAPAKNTVGKGPRLCTSVGDRDTGGKPEKGKGSRRGGKKNSNNSSGSQAPRHKKQQQQQQAIARKPPSRPQSASPSAQNSQSGSGSEQSPSSMPVSTGNSVDSSPAVTPLRDVAGDSNIVQGKQKQQEPDLPASAASKISLKFADDGSRNPSSDASVGDSLERRTTLPIDIPTSPGDSKDTNRDTPQSDSSSSLDRKSPFVRGTFSSDGLFMSNPGSTGEAVDVHQNVPAKSRFMTLKEPETTQSNFCPPALSNGLGFTPFGTASHPSMQHLLHEIPTDNNTMIPQSAPRVVPPPGLTGLPHANLGGWPTSNTHLSDTMPIKSSNDWEAAFGFKPTKEVVSSADDDLGFDPWAECNKGFAEMEKELLTQDTGVRMMEPSLSSSQFGANIATSTVLSDMTAQQQRRPATLPNHLRPNQSNSQFGYPGGQGLINGFSNLLSDPQHNVRNSQQKMPFSYEMQQQIERNRFLQAQQQRLSNHLQHELQEKSLHHLLGSMSRHKAPGMPDPGSPVTPTKEPQSGKHDIQEWQNGLRALLPSVNINFAMQSLSYRQGHPHDSSLGLTGLGMPDPKRMSGFPHPPGMQSSVNPHPFMNKPYVPPPPGVGYPGRSSFLTSRQWSAPDSTMTNPGMSSGRLSGPGALQSLFSSGSRPEPNAMINAMSNYPPDPAIISGGVPGIGSGMRRTRLFEDSHSRTMPGINSNNNSNEEQPHWMKSLHTLTELDSPGNPPQSGTSNLSQLFAQRPSNVPSWSNGNAGLFSAPGFGPSQPPPGFQVRPSLSKPTEFGMAHNLLENQS